MGLYVIGLIVDDTRADDKLYLTGFRLVDIPSELIKDVSIAEARELLFADRIVNLYSSQLYGYLEEYEGSEDDYIEVDDFDFLYFDCGDSQVYTNLNYCIVNKNGKHIGEDGIALFLSGNFGFNLGYRASCNKIMHLCSIDCNNDDAYLDLDSKHKDLIDLPTIDADFSDSDFYDSNKDLTKYINTVGGIATYFGVCRVRSLSEKLLVMPKDCSILILGNDSIYNGMSIVFSNCIQKLYATQYSLMRDSSGIIELNLYFSSSTDSNIVDGIVHTIKGAVSDYNRFKKTKVDLKLNLNYQ